MKKSRKTSSVKKAKASKPTIKKKTSEVFEKPENNSAVSSKDHELTIVEKAQMIVDAGPVNGNEFSRMRYKIASIIVKYAEIRKKCNIQDEFHSKTIYRLAKPFIDGHFTLAVVGKAKAGKSTFMNILMGEDSFLPTGTHQTTSAITYIEDGDTIKIEVKYANGKSRIIEGASVKEELKELVAIPERYKGVPINDINSLISQDYTIDSIIELKEGIESETDCSIIDEKIWRDYIEEHPKEKIVEKIIITHPLPKEFEGWRIVDTPGLGAVGGIQRETKKLFDKRNSEGNNEIDAIIFLHSAEENIEDLNAMDCMKYVYGGLTEDAKNRLFFVISQASCNKFREDGEKTMNKAKELYAKRFGMSEDRFTYMDSLLYKFYKDLKEKEDFEDFDELEELDGWGENNLKKMKELYSAVKIQIKNKDKKEISDETIEEVLRRWANFDVFTGLIDGFITKEKSTTYERIKTLISNDYNLFISDCEQEIKTLNGEMTIQDQREKLESLIEGYKNYLNKINRENQKETLNAKFHFIDEEICKYPDKERQEIEISYRNLRNQTISVRDGLIAEIKSKYKSFYEGNPEIDGLVLEGIDFDELDNEAKANSQEPDYDRPEDDPNNVLKEGTWSRAPVYGKMYRYTKTNEDLKRRNLAAYAITQARCLKEKFINQLFDKVNSFHKNVIEAINERKATEEKRLTILADKLSHDDKKEIEKEIIELEDKIVTIQNTLKNVSRKYSIEDCIIA